MILAATTPKDSVVVNDPALNASAVVSPIQAICN